MSKTETRRLQTRIWKLRIGRHKKTREYRETMALLYMGSIGECRTVRKAMQGGNEHARNMADLMTLREQHLTKSLRKV